MNPDLIDYVTWDDQHNIAYLALRQNTAGPRYAARTLPVQNSTDNEVVAALDFGADGELIGIELLRADSQLSAALKAAARTERETD
ncbi:DUF2283 domain-containing protein [Nocardia brasiliensis]|uniref:DUF2283 domain-containing protein n=1 Tax=Nocardia brasiliensis TaxID=37326 RepID=UPI002453C3DF|nr:DUF2283 domain-containing protein [Nocardia brasiliensis]